MTVFSEDMALLWAGHLGAAFYIGAYGALQSGLIRGSGYTYAILNLIAASLVLISLTNAFNAASAIIQIFWIVISIIGITRIFLMTYDNKFSGDEREMLDDVFPLMPAPMARRLLNHGKWSTLEPGALLTEEMAPVKNLHYILSGEVLVSCAGQPVAEIRRGFVGELNVFSEGPASATVEVMQPTQIFTISGEAIRALCRADAETGLHVEQWLRASIGRKLIESNARLVEAGGSEQKLLESSGF
jgi:CRP-like cAMP-binding protein